MSKSLGPLAKGWGQKKVCSAVRWLEKQNNREYLNFWPFFLCLVNQPALALTATIAFSMGWWIGVERKPEDLRWRASVRLYFGLFSGGAAYLIGYWTGWEGAATVAVYFAVGGVAKYLSAAWYAWTIVSRQAESA